MDHILGYDLLKHIKHNPSIYEFHGQMFDLA